jgi:MinD-like ATPase involved in chromosome partitioning or flagellar assembly
MPGISVLTAVTGASWESHLVTTLDRAPGGLRLARRCVDISDLLAAAAAGHGEVALLSADLRRLDRDVVSRLHECGVAVVGVTPPGASSDDARLHRLGVRRTVPADVDPDALVEAVTDAVAGLRQRRDVSVAEVGDVTVAPAADVPGREGRLIAVWGPCGAPGRTTVAINLAAEAALLGRSTLLADADTYGSSVAQVMGLLDEAPGLAGAARAANRGQLDEAGLARHARQVTPRLRVLTGIARTGRWPELRSSSLEVVWAVARTALEVTVVDTGFCLEQDEELSFDTAAPRRNGATLTTLEQADVVLAVGAADPVGLGRLVRGLADLTEAVPGASVRVVVNRVRKAVAGPDPEAQLAGALQRYAGVVPAAFIPDEPSVLDAALLAGQTLAESAPNSASRRALNALAKELLGVHAVPHRRIGRRREARPAG